MERIGDSPLVFKNPRVFENPRVFKNPVDSTGVELLETPREEPHATDLVKSAERIGKNSRIVMKLPPRPPPDIWAIRDGVSPNGGFTLNGSIQVA